MTIIIQVEIVREHINTITFFVCLQKWQSFAAVLGITSKGFMWLPWAKLGVSWSRASLGFSWHRPPAKRGNQGQHGLQLRLDFERPDSVHWYLCQEWRQIFDSESTLTISTPKIFFRVCLALFIEFYASALSHCDSFALELPWLRRRVRGPRCCGSMAWCSSRSSSLLSLSWWISWCRLRLLVRYVLFLVV